MRPLTSLCTVTTAASLALASLLAAAPQASAAINAPGLNTPEVLDNGAVLRVPIGAVSGGIGDAAIAGSVADALVGDWVGRLIEFAASNSPQTAPACRVAVTAADPDGAIGTASAAVPADASITSLDIPDQARGTQWGVGHLDHVTMTRTCTDVRRNSQLSEVTVDQDAIAA